MHNRWITTETGLMPYSVSRLRVGSSAKARLLSVSTVLHPDSSKRRTQASTSGLRNLYRKLMRCFKTLMLPHCGQAHRKPC